MWVKSQKEKKDILTVHQSEKVSQDAERPSHFSGTIRCAGRVGVDASWTLPCSARLSPRDIPDSARSRLGHLILRHLRSLTPRTQMSVGQGFFNTWSDYESFKVNVATPAVRCSAVRCVAPPPLLPPSRPACPAGLVRGLRGETPAQQQGTNVARCVLTELKGARDVLFARGFCL